MSWGAVLLPTVNTEPINLSPIIPQQTLSERQYFFYISLVFQNHMCRKCRHVGSTYFSRKIRIIPEFQHSFTRSSSFQKVFQIKSLTDIVFFCCYLKSSYLCPKIILRRNLKKSAAFPRDRPRFLENYSTKFNSKSSKATRPFYFFLNWPCWLLVVFLRIFFGF